VIPHKKFRIRDSGFGAAHRPEVTEEET
jgi:hypothetical protein